MKSVTWFKHHHFDLRLKWGEFLLSGWSWDWKKKVITRDPLDVYHARCNGQIYSNQGIKENKFRHCGNFNLFDLVVYTRIWLKAYFKLKSLLSLLRLHLLSQIEEWSQLRPRGKHWAGAPFPARGTYAAGCVEWCWGWLLRDWRHGWWQLLERPLYGVTLQMVSTSLGLLVGTTWTTCISITARPISGKRSAPQAPFQADGAEKKLCGVTRRMASTCLEARMVATTWTTCISTIRRRQRQQRWQRQVLLLHQLITSTSMTSTTRTEDRVDRTPVYSVFCACRGATTGFLWMLDYGLWPRRCFTWFFLVCL